MTPAFVVLQASLPLISLRDPKRRDAFSHITHNSILNTYYYYYYKTRNRLQHWTVGFPAGVTKTFQTMKPAKRIVGF